MGKLKARRKTHRQVLFSKKILWLERFVRVAARRCNLSNLTHVRSYRLPADKEEAVLGCTHRLRNRYSISLLHEHKPKQRKKYVRLAVWDILDVLAHELAHVAMWTDSNDPGHNYEHLMLTSDLHRLFARELRKIGFSDYTKKIPQSWVESGRAGSGI